jgi:hypothetical protein
MKKFTKKEIKTSLEAAVGTLIEKFELPATSKKTKRAIEKVTKTLKNDLKEQAKKVSKKIKDVKGSSKSKAKKKAKQVSAIITK